MQPYYAIKLKCFILRLMMGCSLLLISIGITVSIVQEIMESYDINSKLAYILGLVICALMVLLGVWLIYQAFHFERFVFGKSKSGYVLLKKDMQNESGSNDNTAADNSTSDNTVYTNEDMVGTFRINDENREDYFELMLGAGDSIAAFYYDTDGDTHIYSFSKVSNTKYRDSSNSRNLTIVDYDTIIVNDRTYIRD